MDDSTINEYAALRSRLESLGALTENLLLSLLNDSDLKCHSVGYRVKSHESAEKKASNRTQKYTSVADLTDLLGIRITTYFPDQVDAVASLIEREFVVDPENSVDKRKILDPDRFGYLSMHYIVRLSKARARLPEYRKFADITFEIQIRSILQHAWAEIEHDLGYKSGIAIPREFKRRFARLAGLLEFADVEFCSIRDGLKAYAERVGQEIVTSPEAVELNKESLFEFIKRSEIVKRLDAGIAIQLDGPLKDPDPRSIASKVPQLVEVGIGNIAQLEQALHENEQLVLAFANRWITRRTHRSFPVNSGISLYYLALTLLKDFDDDLVSEWLQNRRYGTKTPLMLDKVRAAAQGADEDLGRTPLSPNRAESE